MGAVPFKVRITRGTRVRACIAALFLLAAIPTAADAGDVRTNFVVSAVVPARASLEAVTQPALLSVSEDDVARGYLEVAAVYRVRNNDPAGYLLRLVPLIGLASAIEVSGLATSVMMREDMVEVTQPAALQARDLNLRFRLTLDPGATTGVYPMPVQVSVATL
jgi:hypothetical protein